MLVQETFACTIDTQTALAKLSCSYGAQAAQTNPNLLLLFICRSLKSEDIFVLVTSTIIYNYRYCVGLHVLFVVVPKMVSCGFSRLVICFVRCFAETNPN